MNCKLCKGYIDETLQPPSGERKVLRWHWSCFQFLAMNGILHVNTEKGEDFTANVLAYEFEQDEKVKT